MTYVESKKSTVTIGKFAFYVIKALTEKDSELIRNQLVFNVILSSRFKILKSVNLEDESLDLGLSEKYQDFRTEIISILKRQEDNRKPVYYEKPFSYYYHVVEKQIEV